MHVDCPEWRQEWRGLLLRVLDERLGQVEAMELEREWAAAEAFLTPEEMGGQEP
jgi:hypothetical protein